MVLVVLVVLEDPEVLELGYNFLETVVQVVLEVLEVLFDRLSRAVQIFQGIRRLPYRLLSKHRFTIKLTVYQSYTLLL